MFLRLVIVSVDRSALKGGITYLDAVLRLREFRIMCSSLQKRVISGYSGATFLLNGISVLIKKGLQ